MTPGHVVVVWLGNLNGHGAADLVGSRSAARLMDDVVAALDAGSDALCRVVR